MLIGRSVGVGGGRGGGGAYISERRVREDWEVKGAKSWRTLSIWDWVVRRVEERATLREVDGDAVGAGP